jgi:cytochrome P450/NADPH-cytochrome P450 reductase
VWPKLSATFHVQDASEEPAPRYDIETVAASADAFPVASGLARLKIAENRELVDMASPFGRSKRHLVVELPEGVSYVAGDHLAVLPENLPEQVERVTRRFRLDPEALVIVRRLRPDDTPILPVDRPVTVRDLVTKNLELGVPATRKDLETLAKYTACPPEKKQLLSLAEEANYKANVLDKRVTLLDLLEENPACELPFAVFLELVPPMKPRLYSISSSPKAAPGRCSVTIAVVDGPAWSGRGRYKGACSAYVQALPAGGKVTAAVREHKDFRLPADPAVPLVLVGAGTGLAPLRGFLEERAALQAMASGTKFGRALLFFGCDHPDVDFLYREELEGWAKRGLCEVYAAFSRAPEGEVAFVQHRVWTERAKVGEVLDAGGHIYVCGDGRAMAPAVRETFGRIHCDRAKAAPTAAEAWLTRMVSEKRYLADVFA